MTKKTFFSPKYYYLFTVATNVVKRLRAFFFLNVKATIKSVTHQPDFFFFALSFSLNYEETSGGKKCSPSHFGQTRKSRNSFPALKNFLPVTKQVLTLETPSIYILCVRNIVKKTIKEEKDE